MNDTPEVEPPHVALGEIGRRFEAGEISRVQCDSRLAELSAPGTSLRRKRRRSVRVEARPPLRFLSIEAVAAERAPAYA